MAVDYSNIKVVHEFGDNEIFEKDIEPKPKNEGIVVEKSVENKDVESPRKPQVWTKTMHSTYIIIGNLNTGVKTKRQVENDLFLLYFVD